MTEVGPGRADASPVGPVVSSWLTTPDRSQLMTPAPARSFTVADARVGETITVDPGRTFQTMDGFGASITDSAADLLSGLPAAQRDRVMRSVFSPTDGIGLSMLRQPIGSSDFVNGPHYTFDDLPPGHTDYSMTKFTIRHDERQILPLLRQALSLNPGIKIVASPWGQPAWMKSNGSLIGGRLINEARIYHAYASTCSDSSRDTNPPGSPSTPSPYRMSRRTARPTDILELTCRWPQRLR